MTRYFLTENTKTVTKVGEKVFEFTPTEFYQPTNSWWGILATDDAADGEGLAALSKSGRIHEITEEEYLRLYAKKKSETGLKLLIDLGNPLDKMTAPIAPAVPVAEAKPAPADLAAVIAPKPTKGSSKGHK